MKLEIFDHANKGLTLLALLYPIVIGFYAVGFFWDFPSDIISYFDLAPFLFKVSIYYLKIIFTISAFGISISFLLIFFPDKNEQGGPARTSQAKKQIRYWSEMPTKNRIMFILSILLAAAVVPIAIWLDHRKFTNLIGTISTIFPAFIMFGLLLKPIIIQSHWSKMVKLFFAMMLLFLPVTAIIYLRKQNGPARRFSTGRRSFSAKKSYARDGRSWRAGLA